MNLEKIRDEFNKYYDLFDKTNNDISYKYTHSYRVEELSKQIAISLNLSDEDIMLATVIGLLHDIGRFKQVEMFGNFKDNNINHADLGVKILFEDNLIEKFNINKKYYEIIKFAIKNHNRLEIEPTDDKRMLLHAKIIRDADKIDIFRAYIVFKDRRLKECGREITAKVKDDFFNKKAINIGDIKHFNDNIVLTLAFVYDLNFKISLELLQKHKILERTFSELEQKVIFKPYFDYLIEYIKKEISYVR